MYRRTFIISASTVTTATLAGCMGSSATDSPESVTETYYEGESESEIEDVLHPESELGVSEEELEGIEFSVSEVEVLEEDIDMDGLNDEGLRPGTLDEDTFDEVASEEDVALVEAVVTINDEPDEISSLTLAATDDGDWYVLDEAPDQSGAW